MIFSVHDRPYKKGTNLRMAVRVCSFHSFEDLLPFQVALICSTE
jgi:hypothetical protein